MDDFGRVDAWCADLISQLEPGARKALARDIAKYLRARNQKRIAAQLNPDGSAFAERKPQIRHKKGAIRRQMFAKLRTAKYLKADATSEEATVRFSSTVARIAQVHHFGLRDKVNRRLGLEADYPARQLLGIPEEDEAGVREIIAAHLAR